MLNLAITAAEAIYVAAGAGALIAHVWADGGHRGSLPNGNESAAIALCSVSAAIGKFFAVIAARCAADKHAVTKDLALGGSEIRLGNSSIIFAGRSARGLCVWQRFSPPPTTTPDLPAPSQATCRVG